MRDFTKIACRIWRSKKFKALDEHSKLLYIYLLSNTNINSAGCYHMPAGYICVDLKWGEDELSICLESLIASDLISYDESEEVVFVFGWFAINPPINPKHSQKICSDIENLPDTEERRKCLQELEVCLTEKGWVLPKRLVDNSVDNSVDNFMDKGYRKGIERVSPQDKTKTGTETYTETKTERVRKQDCHFEIEDYLDDKLREQIKMDAPRLDFNGYILPAYRKFMISKDVPKNPVGSFRGFVKKCYSDYVKENGLP